MLDRKLLNIAKRFSDVVKFVIGWATGFFLFLFILSYIVLSFLVRFIARLFGLQGLYHFREDQFLSLDVMPKGDEESCFLGRLPAKKNEVLEYDLPSGIQAKEMLLELKLHNRSSDGCIELDYCVYSSDEEQTKEHCYFFINALHQMPDLSYRNVVCWFPVPKNNRLAAQLTDMISDQEILSVSGDLNVLKWR